MHGSTIGIEFSLRENEVFCHEPAQVIAQQLSRTYQATAVIAQVDNDFADICDSESRKHSVKHRVGRADERGKFHIANISTVAGVDNAPLRYWGNRDNGLGDRTKVRWVVVEIKHLKRDGWIVENGTNTLIRLNFGNTPPVETENSVPSKKPCVKCRADSEYACQAQVITGEEVETKAKALVLTFAKKLRVRFCRIDEAEVIQRLKRAQVSQKFFRRCVVIDID